ncbi:MAG TPA: HNH endonuclease signature motif containing protein [Acidimicrobiales bacterium]|nr:HNH endonuclease signature motif containing protein [Acidimicrobiales bacterium]
MCDTLSELRAELSRFTATFEPAVLSASQAHSVVEAATAVERMAAVLKAKAAARCAQTRSWRSAGERSAAAHLARTTASTLGQAADAIATARRLEGLPALDAAARSGALSAEQTAAIADAAAADAAAETRLVSDAAHLSLAELRAECARTKAAACGDLEARRRRIHERRSARDWTDPEGVWHLHLRHNPEVGARFMAALAPLRDRQLDQARTEGRREPPEAYAADALVEKVCGRSPADGTSGKSPPPPGTTKVIVRVDLPALLRGYPARGETCEIAGFGPVAVSAVRDLLDTADPFLASVVTAGEAVVGVAHFGRRPRTVQRTALEWLYPTCGAEGCNTTAFLEIDHRVEWAQSHVTVFDLLDRLCPHHHDLKTRDGWALVEGRGKRPFVPPDDPRHPARSHDPPVPA